MLCCGSGQRLSLAKTYDGVIGVEASELMQEERNSSFNNDDTALICRVLVGWPETDAATGTNRPATRRPSTTIISASLLSLLSFSPASQLTKNSQLPTPSKPTLKMKTTFIVSILTLAASAVASPLAAVKGETLDSKS